MKQSIILGIGAGQCGLKSLARLLNLQPGVQSSYEELPFLPWDARDGDRVIQARFKRFRDAGHGQILGDVASFYLPYVETAIAAEPGIRIVCLRGPRDEVVKSFVQWTDNTMPLPTNHWAKQLANGWHHDPVRTPTYPQYDVTDREEGIRRYWDEYYTIAERLAKDRPHNFKIFDAYAALNSAATMAEMLGFLGVPNERQVLQLGLTDERKHSGRQPSWARPSNGSAMDPSRCVVLVPYTGSILPQCERGLHALERRGYVVRRVGGYAAIDQGRNQMATDALIDGYEETIWIDSDVDFQPEAVERLRQHGLPISCAVYPQKGKRALASCVLPGTQQVVFGAGGGLLEVLYAGAGFLHVRREVYMKVQRENRLQMCNERFRSVMVPYFLPMVCPTDDGHWYLAEDFAFCQRARECGYKIMADTTIRLSHIGNHAYSWEESGQDIARFDTFVLNLSSSADGDGKTPTTAPSMSPKESQATGG